MKILRSDQVVLINNIRESLRGTRRVQVGAPTGAGKTVVMAEIVSRARDKDKKVLITCPAISLIDQTIMALHAQGVDEIGAIQADHHMTDWSRPVQVASVQTLQRRWCDHQMPKADLVLVDESHRMFTMFSEWMLHQDWLKIPFVGFSATPWSKGLGLLYTDLVTGLSMRQLIEAKVLVPFRTFAPDAPDLAGVRTVAGEFVAADLDEVMRPKKLVANLCETWKQMADGRPTVCFCCSRAHADQVAKEFAAAGVGSGYVDCETPLSERAEVRRRMLAGEIKIITNVDVVGLGVDWPEVSCIIYARPTMSDIRFCLDSETEILTSRGWCGMGQVRKGDCVATMADIATGRGQWSRVLASIERDMDANESWIEYHGPQSDFRVTNNHRMIFARRPVVRRKDFVELPYQIAAAERMLDWRDSKRIPVAVSMEQPGVPLTDAELYFIGMMMTDGTWSARTGQISQSERHPEVIERIERCLRDCGIAYSKRRIPTPTALNSAVTGFYERHHRWQYSLSYVKPKDAHGKYARTQHLQAIKRRYEYVPGRVGFAHLLPFLDKDFAPALMALSKSQFFVLLQGIHDGDGFKMKSPSIDWTPRSWTLCSARKLFVERLQALAVINGCGAHLHQEQRNKPNRRPMYVISITPKNWRSVGGYEKNRPKIECNPATAERVWCVETETGTVVTRRRGKVMVMGNCQNIGRGLRAAPGKEDLLILDHSTTTQRLGFVDEIYSYHPKLDDGKTKAKGEPPVLLPKECPACHLLKPPRVAKCPHCGHEVIAHADPVPVERGTLREVKVGDDMANLRKQLPDKPHVFGQLWWYGQMKGYKPGWAANKTREIFGSYPRAREPDEAHISEPVPELLGYIYLSTEKWKREQYNAKRRERWGNAHAEREARQNGHVNGNGHMNGHDDGALDDRAQAVVDRAAQYVGDSLMRPEDWDDFR